MMNIELDSIFATFEDYFNYASSYSTTSEEDNELSASEWEDGPVDPFMFCSPTYFAFIRGTYDLTVNDLLRKVKGIFETSSDVARGAPPKLHGWRHMKSRLMLRNEK